MNLKIKKIDTSKLTNSYNGISDKTYRAGQIWTASFVSICGIVIIVLILLCQ